MSERNAADSSVHANDLRGGIDTVGQHRPGRPSESGPDTITVRSGYPARLADVIAQVEYQLITHAIVCEGSCVAAARSLGVSKRTLFYKMHNLGIRTAHTTWCRSIRDP